MLDLRLCTLALTLGSLALPAPSRQEMPQPTAQHHEIQGSVGTWEGTMTSFIPGVPSEPVPARETVASLGAFWTQVRFECDFMGMPYVGAGHVGYDERSKEYVGTWIDSMSSYLALMRGEMDADGKTLVMKWEAPDESGDLVPHRSETVRTENEYTSTFFMGEPATKSMVLAMKRTSKTVEANAPK